MNHIERLNELYKQIDTRLGGDLNWLKDDRTALVALAELIESWLALFDELEAELKERYTALAAELKAKKDELQTALETKHGELETQLVAKKDELEGELVTKHGELEGELTAKKDELQTALETRKGELDAELVTKKDDLETELVTKKDELQNSLNVSNEEFKTQQTQRQEAYEADLTQKQNEFEASLTQKQNEFEAAQTQEQTLQNTRIGTLEVALIDNVAKLKEQDESIRQELNNSQTQQNADFDGKIQNVKTEFEASQQTQNADFDGKIQNVKTEFEASQQTQNADFDGKIQNVKTEFDTKFVKKGELDAELDPYFKIQTHWWKFLRFGWGVPENDVRKMFCFNQDREGHEDKMVFQIGGAGLGFKEYNGKRYLATDNESDNHGKSYKLLEERDLRDDSLLGKEERGVKVKELNNGFLKTIKLGDTTLDETTLKHIIEVCNNIDGNLVP